MTENNIRNCAERGKKKMPEDYGLVVTDFLDLVRMASDCSASGLLDTITTAYNAGFEVGTRYEAMRHGGAA